ncbi:hypothetical protein [Pseudomonas sp. Pseu.R1]|uniref:hypothetical protein n=1 Tax=Pseudomonas sp. Pseu.R1 TaxID=3379818 RepID=UPI003B942456
MKVAIKRCAITVMIGLGSTALVGCSDSEKEPAKHQATAPAKAQTKEDLQAIAQIAAENQPLKVEYEAAAPGADSDYHDLLTPIAPLRYYTALRGWEETPEEIIKSVTDQIAPSMKLDNASLYENGYGIITTDDAFRKRDLGQNVINIVKTEAAKVGKDKRLVKIVTRDHLDPYNFDSKGFGVSACLFSDKLEYTKEETRNPQTFSRAPKPRCFLRTMADFNVGVVGGSKVFFSMTDENLAKKVEANRERSHLVVYGYVQSIERQRLGGKLFENRYVLVAPQRVDVVDNQSGDVIVSQKL